MTFGARAARGSAGPWDGNGYGVSYQVADGEETKFSEETLRLSVCPDGYMQGGIELASNARLSNAAAGSAVIFGDVVATGKNAVISGGFKLEGGRLVFRNVSPDARDLTEMLSFTNAAEGYLAGVSEIAVDFAS